MWKYKTVRKSDTKSSKRYTERDEPFCAVCGSRVYRLQWVKVGPNGRVAHIHCRLKRNTNWW